MRHSFTKKPQYALKSLEASFRCCGGFITYSGHTRYVHAQLVANLTEKKNRWGGPGAGAVGIDGLTHPIVAAVMSCRCESVVCDE